MNTISRHTPHANEQSHPAALQASMNVSPVGGALQLHGSEQLRMRDASGWTVQALKGMVWITQESDSRDIVLRPGQSFTLDRPGYALVSSEGEADICLKQEAAVKKVPGRTAESKFVAPFSAARALFA